MIFDVIVGALFVGATVIMGVEKVNNVAKSIKQDGFVETTKKEAKKGAEFISKEYERASKDYEKKNKSKK